MTAQILNLKKNIQKKFIFHISRQRIRTERESVGHENWKVETKIRNFK